MKIVNLSNSKNAPKYAFKIVYNDQLSVDEEVIILTEDSAKAIEIFCAFYNNPSKDRNPQTVIGLSTSQENERNYARARIRSVDRLKGAVLEEIVDKQTL